MTGFAGSGILTRLALQRDRIMLASWVYGLTAVSYASVAATKKLYPTVASRMTLAVGAGANEVTRALYGQASDLHTLGGLATYKLQSYGPVLAAVMSIIIVTRHTRGDEDAGRLELVGAGVVGRSASLTAALLTAFLANLALALLVAVGLAFAGLAGTSSLAFGLGVAVTGCVFAALTGVVAQLAGNARTVTGIVAAVLGLMYVLRAAGDTAAHGSWLTGLSWVSPIGWSEQLRPFGPRHWWVLAIAPLVTIALGAAAYVLAARRDLGAGLLPTRPGPAAAAAGLRGPLGLAWRLQRGTLLGWVGTFAVYSLVIGALAVGIADLVGNNTAARNMFYRLGGHAGLTDAYLAATIGMLGLLASVYAVRAALRPRGEENGQRAEPVLAAAVGRTRWALSHLTFAFLGPAVLLIIAGLGEGLADGLRSGDAGTEVPRLLGGALAQVPAVWVLAGIAVALFGLAPRLAAMAWVALVAFLVLTELGSVLGLSHWAIDLSPFTHVPKLPGGVFTATPLIWLTAVAVILTGLGLAGLRRRDMG